MWYTKVLAFLFPVTTFALNKETLQFSVNYFKERNVPFICLVSCGNMMWDMKFAKEASLFNSMYVSKLDIDNLSLGNMEKCFHQSYTKTGVLINAQCDAAEQIFYAASENMWLDASHIWLVLDKGEHMMNKFNTSIHSQNSQPHLEDPGKALQILYNMNLSVNADIVLALEEDGEFKLYDVFNFGKIQGGNFVIKNVGSWSQKTKSNAIAKLNVQKYHRRWDFEQMPMRMISVITPLTKNLDQQILTGERPNPRISTVTKIANTILEVVAELHNIKFVHTLTDIYQGKYERNETVKSVTSALYFGEQDLSSTLRLQKYLLDRVEFVYPALTYLGACYYYKIPSYGPGKFENQFIRPLSTGVWLGVLGVCTICTIILIMAAKLESRPASVQYGFFSVFASFCQQFFEDEVSTSKVSTARKLTTFVTGLSCLIIYNYYTSSVVSWLLSGQPPSINSLQELLESPLELIFQDNGYARSWLSTPYYYFTPRNARIEDKLKEKAWSKSRKLNQILKSLDDGFTMMKSGGYAFHIEKFIADGLISQTFDQKELCELGSVVSLENTFIFGCVQKKSPFKEFLTWRLTRLQECGIKSCIQRRLTVHPPTCGGSSPRALALGGAAPAFIMLAFGSFLGTVIMFIERFVYKMKMKSRRRFNHRLSIKIHVMQTSR